MKGVILFTAVAILGLSSCKRDATCATYTKNMDVKEIKKENQDVKI